MTYKEIDRDLLIRKRRIAFELGESNLPKYAKKFIERVLDSEELTPTFSEAEIRAEAIRKYAEWLEENVFIDVENGVTVVEEVEYTRVISFMELLAMYEKEQKGENK